jgi:hypothetical protein
MYGALALLAVAAAHGTDLGASIRASARPALCAPQAAAADAAPSQWDTLRERKLAELCVELGRAQVRLATDPLTVLTRARELAQQWPGRAEPWVLQARARVRLGEYGEAWQAFGAARERGEELRAAHVARDYAVAARMTGQDGEAVAAYRRLVPLAALWPDPLLAQRLLLEAAAATLTRGPEGMNEALGYLAAVRPRTTSAGLRTVALGLDALAAYRRGQAPRELEQASAPEVWHFVEQVRGGAAGRAWPVIPRPELQAAASLLVERYSASEAAELWRPYAQMLAGAGGEAALRAQQRLERLERGSGSP